MIKKAVFRGAIGVAAALLMWSVASAEPTLVRARQLQREAAVAYQRADYEAAIRDFKAALALRPHHPGLTYNLAATSAKAGKTRAAIALLRSYAAMGLVLDVSADPDFARLKEDPSFESVVARLKANAGLVGASKIALTLKGEAFLAEGLIYDAATSRFFVSSVDRCLVASVAPDGSTTDFVASARDGLLGGFGMAIDKLRRRVWVASSGLPQASGLSAAEKDTGGVFAFVLADGKLVHRALVPNAPEKHAIGDLTLDAQGNVFASDSLVPVIYRIDGATGALAEWLRNDEFGSLQGLAFSPDSTKLIVADYARGLHVIDVATKAIRRIEFAGGTTLLGIDGIYTHGRELIAVQNGVNPQRVLAVRMTADWSNAAAVRVISANDPNLPEPVLGTIVGDDFYVVGNGQWSRFADDGTRKDALEPVNIVKIGLCAGPK